MSDYFGTIAFIIYSMMVVYILWLQYQVTNTRSTAMELFLMLRSVALGECVVEMRGDDVVIKDKPEKK